MANDSIETSLTNTKDGVNYAPYVLAAGVLVAYGFFVYYLIGKVNAEDPDWSRLIYLFSGVEAIVFAAAGFLFGKEVNRKRAERAEKDVKQVEKQKDVAQEEAVEERKKALILGAMAIQAEQTATINSDQGSLEMASVKTPVNNIAEKARRLYPELENL